MTREEKLYSMKMTDLTNVANKLGIKINKDTAKSEAVEKILAAENANNTLITNINEVTETTNPDDIDDDTYTELIMQQKKDLNIECPKIEEIEICGDGTPLAEVGKEIAEQAKAKAALAAVNKMTPDEVVNTINKVVMREKLVQMPGTSDPNWGEKHFSNDIDETLLVKLTKKQQRIITKIYKDDDRIYHVTVNHNGNISDLKDKSLSKIYLMINAIIKGE